MTDDELVALVAEDLRVHLATDQPVQTHPLLGSYRQALALVLSLRRQIATGCPDHLDNLPAVLWQAEHDRDMACRQVGRLRSACWKSLDHIREGPQPSIEIVLDEVLQ